MTGDRRRVWRDQDGDPFTGDYGTVPLPPRDYPTRPSFAHRPPGLARDLAALKWGCICALALGLALIWLRP